LGGRSGALGGYFQNTGLAIEQVIERMFDILKWMAEISESQFSYDSLNELLENQDALKHHLSNFEMMEFTETGEVASRPISPDDFIQGSYLDAYINKMQEVIYIYRRQMVVLFVTYVESIVFDFMKSLFLAYPARMYEFLDMGTDQKIKGKIDLKEILDANTKDELIGKLAQRTASVATRGKFETVVNNLEKVSKSKLDTVLIKKLKYFTELRNKIVHEASKKELTDQAVRDGFEAVNNLLQSLGKIAAQKNIPYSFIPEVEENI